MDGSTGKIARTTTGELGLHGLAPPCPLLHLGLDRGIGTRRSLHQLPRGIPHLTTNVSLLRPPHQPRQRPGASAAVPA